LSLDFPAPRPRRGRQQDDPLHTPISVAPAKLPAHPADSGRQIPGAEGHGCRPSSSVHPNVRGAPGRPGCYIRFPVGVSQMSVERCGNLPVCEHRPSEPLPSQLVGLPIHEDDGDDLSHRSNVHVTRQETQTASPIPLRRVGASVRRQEASTIRQIQ